MYLAQAESQLSREEVVVVEFWIVRLLPDIYVELRGRYEDADM